MRVGSSPPVWQTGATGERKLEVAAAEGASWKLQQQPVKAGGCSPAELKDQNPV